MALVWMRHPSLSQRVRVPEESFYGAWQGKGWEIAPAPVFGDDDYVGPGTRLNVHRKTVVGPTEPSGYWELWAETRPDGSVKTLWRNV